MSIISTNNFHNGLTIELDGDIYTIVNFQHSKMARGSAFVRTKLKNVETGQVIERTFRAGEKVKKAHLDKRQKQYLYQSGEQYIFMDMETYEQIALSEEDLGDGVNYLKDNMIVDVLMYEGKAIGVEVPTFVELEVVKTVPGVKGDTVSGGTKPATLETGITVNVPLFIKEGDVIKVDTRTGDYIERV